MTTCKPCDCGGDCAAQKAPYLGEKFTCERCDEIALNILSSVPKTSGCVHCDEIERIVLGPAPAAAFVPEPMPTVVPVPKFVTDTLDAIQHAVFEVMKKLNLRVE